MTSGARVHIIGERSARRCFLWVKKIGRIRSRAEVLAVVYVVVFALLLIDAQWPFLSNVDWLYAVFKGIWTYGAFVIAAVVGLEAMVKRNFLLFLIFAALLVVCVIFIFFPGTYENLLNFIPSK